MLLKHRNRMLRAIDLGRVRQAIDDAERETSGEIRVSVAPFFWGDVQKAAERAFTRLGMTATRERNGVLFFLVPARRRFAVLGDEAIHARMGPEFWQHVTAAVAKRFRKGDFTGGLVHGIETVGRELAAHFPPDPDHPHQLPDDVDLGR
jgi:uncharacterized membrane protein